ncbi:MAG TPA: phage holin family protein [Solirubrobacteraceae bacterium]|nr:phage holin family protein [Solirubrobacteraceae bacterium]
MAAETPPKPAPESLGAAVSEVSERMSLLVREEIELAKAEMTTKVSSIARGAAAVAVGAVFGIFALVFVLLSIAWAVNAITGSLWIGFVVVMVVLLVLTAFAFLFAWRKLKVGAPTPKMAIDEAKKIGSTVASSSSGQTTSIEKGAS